MPEQSLLINEIFHSIQGESTWSGLPCTFVRLRGCPLRCRYCDTSYSFKEGGAVSIEEILHQVAQYNTNLVEVTGGEPMLQPAIHHLLTKLLDKGYQVLLETCGNCDLSICDDRLIRIIDIKTPYSGAADSFFVANYDSLRKHDEVKFVITNREDFDWALSVVLDKSLCQKVNAVHFSPVMEQVQNACVQGCEALPPDELSAWILESDMPIRLQLQIHKYIWSPLLRGV